MDIPTSWTDLSMNWSEVHIAPFNPYFVALAEAISERAISVGKEGSISSDLLTPYPLYEISGYASDIQSAVTLLIPEFINPSTQEPWTEEQILDAIDAEERITANYYNTAEWLSQQYDLLNKLGLIERAVGVSVSPLTQKRGYQWPEILTLEATVALYNSASFASSLSTSLTILSGDELVRWDILGYSKEVIITEYLSLPIPDGAACDVYMKFTGSGSFIPLGIAQEEDVWYNTNSITWNASAGYSNLGVVVDAPASVSAGMFTESTNKCSHFPGAFVYYLDPTFNFTI